MIAAAARSSFVAEPGAPASRPTLIPPTGVPPAPIGPDDRVPRRTSARVDRLDLRTAFVLMHVNDVASLREIAASASLPIHEVTSIVLELCALDLVALPGATATVPPPSGVRLRG